MKRVGGRVGRLGSDIGGGDRLESLIFAVIIMILIVILMILMIFTMLIITYR